MKNQGQRSWSVSLSIADITNSILTDKMKTHSVSTLAQVASHYYITRYSIFSRVALSVSSDYSMTFHSYKCLVLFTSGLGWNRCRSVSQPAVHYGIKWFHASGWSLTGTRRRRQTQGKCYIPLQPHVSAQIVSNVHFVHWQYLCWSSAFSLSATYSKTKVMDDTLILNMYTLDLLNWVQ